MCGSFRGGFGGGDGVKGGATMGGLGSWGVGVGALGMGVLVLESLRAPLCVFEE